MIVSKNKEANTDPWKSGRRKPCDSCRDKYALRRGIYSVEYCKIAGARTPLFFRSVIPSAGQTNITRVALEDALRTFVFFSLKIFQGMQRRGRSPCERYFSEKTKRELLHEHPREMYRNYKLSGAFHLQFLHHLALSSDLLDIRRAKRPCRTTLRDDLVGRSHREHSETLSFVPVREASRKRACPRHIWIHPGLKRDESREISRH